MEYVDGENLEAPSSAASAASPTTMEALQIARQLCAGLSPPRTTAASSTATSKPATTS